jgi:hypothetical protein
MGTIWPATTGEFRKKSDAMGHTCNEAMSS